MSNTRSKSMRMLRLSRFGICLLAFIAGGFFADAAVAQQGNDPPGVVVTKSPDFETMNCAFPSIVVLPNGDYLISMAYEGKKARNETEVYVSKNKGRDWEKCSTIEKLSGASFVTKDDTVFLMGTEKKTGTAAIVESSDNGATWSKADRLMISDSHLYSMPNAMLVHNDRVWRSYTSVENGEWTVRLFWAPYSSNWLDADNWTEVEPAKGKTNFLGERWNPVHQPNPVPTPNGIALLACVKAKNRIGTAAILPVSNDGRSLEFDEASSLIDFPGGGEKFTARFDQKSKKYWAIVNKQKNPFAKYNYQVLVSSSNLRDWEINSVLFRHVDNYYFGKRHADWVFDGEDLIAVSMTAWKNSKNAEKPTHTVFDRVKNFRSLNSTRVANTHGEKPNQFRFTSMAVSVTGKYVDIKSLNDGVGAVSHFSTKYTKVPDRIKGWKLFRTRGGYPCEIVVKANSDCEIFMVTDLSGTGVVDVSGWTKEPEVLKREKNESGLFSRQLKKGEKIVLPQGTWAGCQLLLPP